MNLLGIKVLKRAINKMKNPKVYSKDIFNDIYVNTPRNNLKYGELKLVFNKDDVIKKSKDESHHRTTSNSSHENKRKIDKDVFIQNVMKWSTELTMTDEEYKLRMRQDSLEERMKEKNIRIINR